MKNELNKIFAASECPPEEVLCKYHEGKLFGSEKNSVEKHLASCEACSDELEGMFFINNNFNLDKTVAGLKENINARLGIGGKKNSFSFYIKIAAVITVLLVSSFIIYLTVNSDQTISKNALLINTETQKSELESLPDLTIKAEEKKVETSEKSISAKGIKSVEKETDLKSESQLMEKINPTQESVVVGSTSKDVTIKSDEDRYFSTIAENKKELEKIDKKDISQDGTGAGVSTVVNQTGSGKASVKTVVVDASEQKLSENQNNISANSVVTTKTSSETSKTDDVNNNITADNRNQQKENNKYKEETERKKNATDSREKSKDEFKSKKQSDKEGEKFRAEETEKKFELKEEASDKLAISNSKSSGKESKKKAKAESPDKKNEAGSGESKKPSGDESEYYDQAISKYKSGKYDEAVNLFQQIIAGNSSDYKALYYEGVCFYEQGKAEKAIADFELVINLNSGEFADDARWYMALSYIKLNNKETARKKLQEIISKGGKHKAKAEKKIDEVK